MSVETAALEAALAEALAHPEPAGAAPLAAAIPMPAQTAIVVDPSLGAAAAALAPLARALARQAIRPGRMDLVVAWGGDRGAERACGLAAARALGLERAHLRDPEAGDHFLAGTIDGASVEVDDVLREAEAVIVVTRDRAGEPPWRALAPGIVSARTARALAAARGPGAPERRDALLRLVRVDWAVRFGGAKDAAAPRVRAGSPASVWSDAGAS